LDTSRKLSTDLATPARDITKKSKPGSITEVIAAAADVVIARPLLMIVPVLVDLYYLAGWKITAGHTFDRLRGSALDLDSSEGDQLARYVADAAGSDLTGVVSFVIPSFLAGATSDKLYRPFHRNVIGLDNWGALMLAIVILIGVSMCLFGVFGLWLADTGLKRNRTWGNRLRLGPVVGGRFVLMLLLVLAMVLLLCVPLFVAMLIAAILGIGLEGLALSISVLVGLGLYVLFYFAPDSLLVDLAGPVQSLRASSAVVRRNLLATLGFAIVSIIISVGLADIWDRIATSAPGLAIAVVANAFVGCVLWIASLLFFSERSKLLATERAASTSNRPIS
jgi:hypothetical protein